MIADKNLNMIVLDDIHVLALKPAKVKFIDTTYLTDGTQKILESDMLFGLTECRLNEPIPAGTPPYNQEVNPPYCYCMNDGVTMTGIFFDYYPTDKLKSNRTARAAFNVWFETICMNWMSKNGLAPKSKKPPVPDAYDVKVIGNVSISLTPVAGT